MLFFVALCPLINSENPTVKGLMILPISKFGFNRRIRNKGFWEKRMKKQIFSISKLESNYFKPNNIYKNNFNSKKKIAM